MSTTHAEYIILPKFQPSKFGHLIFIYTQATMVISLLCGLIRSLVIEQENLLIEDGSKSSFEYYSVEENDELSGYLIFNVPEFTYAFKGQNIEPVDDILKNSS